MTILDVLFVVFAPLGMMMSFDFQFTVSNNSVEPVWITPLGAVHDDNRRRVLPMINPTSRFIPFAKRSRFRLEPGAGVRLVYDYDDIQFTDILVETTAGPSRELAVGSLRRDGQYSPPQRSSFVIPTLTRLPVARPEVSGYAAGAPRNQWIYFLMALGIVAPFSLRYARRRLGLIS